MRIIRIKELPFPGTEPYLSLTDHQLREGFSLSSPLIVVESPKVIMTALEKGLQPVSLLTEERHLTGDAAEILTLLAETNSLNGEIDIFTGEREILECITGYRLTRGVLCAMKRPAQPTPQELLKDAKRVCIIQDVNNTTNIGSIFRSAAALGIDAVLLSKGTCDPFNRRSIRVSMGSVFQVAWCETADPISTARHLGFKTIGMALCEDSVRLDELEAYNDEKIAIVVGTEGEGLPEEELAKLDVKAIIPMHYTVDSLNVGVAAGIAFWHLRRKL